MQELELTGSLPEIEMLERGAVKRIFPPSIGAQVEALLAQADSDDMIDVVTAVHQRLEQLHPHNPAWVTLRNAWRVLSILVRRHTVRGFV